MSFCLTPGNVDDRNPMESLLKNLKGIACGDKGYISKNKTQSLFEGKDMQKMLEDSGYTLLYLPPYSPDLNPIEQKWAHAKQIRRSTNCFIDQILSTYLT